MSIPLSASQRITTKLAMRSLVHSLEELHVRCHKFPPEYVLGFTRPRSDGDEEYQWIKTY